MCIQSVRRGATQPIVAILLILMTTSLDSNEKIKKKKMKEKYLLNIDHLSVISQKNFK